jgi:hypothetical protein
MNGESSAGTVNAGLPGNDGAAGGAADHAAGMLSRLESLDGRVAICSLPGAWVGG